MDGFVIGMIITGLCSLLFTVLGIYMMLTGRGSFLIAGYNTMSKKEKGKYDNVSLCKFIGKFIILIGISTILFAIGLTAGAMYSVLLLWITIILYFIIVMGFSLFVVIYCNTGNRFRK